MRSKDPDPRKCALSERARGLVFFLLTLTYMEVGNPDTDSELKTPSGRVSQPHLQRGYAGSFMRARNSSFPLVKPISRGFLGGEMVYFKNFSLRRLFRAFHFCTQS